MFALVAIIPFVRGDVEFESIAPMKRASDVCWKVDGEVEMLTGCVCDPDYSRVGIECANWSDFDLVIAAKASALGISLEARAGDVRSYGTPEAAQRAHRRAVELGFYYSTVWQYRHGDYRLHITDRRVA
jgi:hypothetical protein